MGKAIIAVPLTRPLDPEEMEGVMQTVQSKFGEGFRFTTDLSFAQENGVDKGTYAQVKIVTPEWDLRDFDTAAFNVVSLVKRGLEETDSDVELLPAYDILPEVNREYVLTEE